MALILGLIGCIFPALPGPPIAYGSLVALYFHSAPVKHPSSSALLWYGLAVALVTALDYFLPIWGTKKLGGTNAGKRGSTIGLFAGIFLPVFGPFTILIGPFIGAVAGELLSGQNQQTAIRSGIGSFLGFISGTILKLGMVGVIAYEFIKLAW